MVFISNLKRGFDAQRSWGAGTSVVTPLPPGPGTPPIISMLDLQQQHQELVAAHEELKARVAELEKK